MSVADLTPYQLLDLYATILVGVLKANCPKDTYQLASKIKKTTRGEDIEVRIGEGVVSANGVNYAKFTNEKWIDERWNGKQNPNEGWVERSIEQASKVFMSQVKGVVINELQVKI